MEPSKHPPSLLWVMGASLGVRLPWVGGTLDSSRWGILAPTGARCHLHSVNTSGEFRRDLGKGGVTPQHPPPTPAGCTHGCCLPSPSAAAATPCCGSTAECPTPARPWRGAPRGGGRQPVGAARGSGTGAGAASCWGSGSGRAASEPRARPHGGIGFFWGVVVTSSPTARHPPLITHQPSPTARHPKPSSGNRGGTMAVPGRNRPGGRLGFGGLWVGIAQAAGARGGRGPAVAGVGWVWCRVGLVPVGFGQEGGSSGDGPWLGTTLGPPGVGSGCARSTAGA